MAVFLILVTTDDLNILVPVWERFTRRRSFVRAIASRLPHVLFEGIDMQGIQILERKTYGWTRSVVQIIGTLLPLESCPRPHFQKFIGPEVLETKEYEAVKRPDIASLVDAPCLLDDNDLMYTRFRHDLQSNKSMDPNNSDSGFLTMMSAKRVCEKSLLPADDHAFQKIAALEDELLQLRAQIAAIVALQQSQAAQSHTESLYSFGSPGNALPPPSSASRPLSAQFLQCTTPVAPLPLPPPPPPPPPPPVPSTQLKSALDLIRECKGFHKCSPTESEASEKGSVDQLPSMMDVLKGMNSIKLRAVERTPGGKPSTRKDKKKRSLNDPTDPAAIIAKAWKHKFAHRNGGDVVNKENRSHEESPFSSPNGPLFGRHLLNPIRKITQKEITRKQVHV
ncbi:mitochondrial fission regulator 2-like [Phyllobates terribilis]|uniref:mitochondrial fission regulator 2-like n=1 Tax=Phyllobates terribilis TaxID=111132 RepID=UPI003CCA7579